MPAFDRCVRQLVVGRANAAIQRGHTKPVPAVAVDPTEPRETITAGEIHRDSTRRRGGRSTSAGDR